MGIKAYIKLKYSENKHHGCICLVMDPSLATVQGKYMLVMNAVCNSLPPTRLTNLSLN